MNKLILILTVMLIAAVAGAQLVTNTFPAGNPVNKQAVLYKCTTPKCGGHFRCTNRNGDRAGQYAHKCLKCGTTTNLPAIYPILIKK